jgi:FtsP/CotA-like multicopper oxidase with cupredoxin domain
MPLTFLGSVRGRRQSLYRRWARRWATIVVDSFQRINEDTLGSADTGHDWRPYVNSADWVIRSGKARLRVTTAGNKERCRVQSGLSDGTVRARINVNNVTLQGVGISFRETVTNNCWTFAYKGGTSYQWTNWNGGTLITSTAVSGPALTAGQSYELKVVMSGNQFSGYVDGTQVGATQTSATNQTETIHGIFSDGIKETLFERFVVLRG